MDADIVKMINVIICPVNKSTIQEFHFGDDISAIVDNHMLKEHHDWFKETYLEWLPRNGSHCPICYKPFRNASGVDHHVQLKHMDYEKIDTLEYRLKVLDD